MPKVKRNKGNKGNNGNNAEVSKKADKVKERQEQWELACEVNSLDRMPNTSRMIDVLTALVMPMYSINYHKMSNGKKVEDRRIVLQSAVDNALDELNPSELLWTGGNMVQFDVVTWGAAAVIEWMKIGGYHVLTRDDVTHPNGQISMIFTF